MTLIGRRVRHAGSTVDAVTQPEFVHLQTEGHDDYRLSRTAFDVFMYALEWTIVEFDDPGLIPRGLVETLKRSPVGRPDPAEDVEELVRVGLWQRVDEDGYRVTDQSLIDRAVQAFEETKDAWAECERAGGHVSDRQDVMITHDGAHATCTVCGKVLDADDPVRVAE
jgi:hypothetical protein